MRKAMDRRQRLKLYARHPDEQAKAAAPEFSVCRVKALPWYPEAQKWQTKLHLRAEAELFMSRAHDTQVAEENSTEWRTQHEWGHCCHLRVSLRDASAGFRVRRNSSCCGFLSPTVYSLNTSVLLRADLEKDMPKSAKVPVLFSQTSIWRNWGVWVCSDPVHPSHAVLRKDGPSSISFWCAYEN